MWPTLKLNSHNSQPVLVRDKSMLLLHAALKCVEYYVNVSICYAYEVQMQPRDQYLMQHSAGSCAPSWRLLQLETNFNCADSPDVTESHNP